METIITEYLQLYGLLAVFMLMSANGFASSPPSELVLALSGFWVSVTNSQFLDVFAVAVLGNIIGTYSLYLIGRHIGDDWLYKIKNYFLRRKITRAIGRTLPDKKKVEFGVRFINTYGNIWVCILRCMPVVRSIISLPAGIAKMPHKVFLFYSTIGIMAWAGLWMSVGYAAKNIWLNHKWSISLLFLVALIAVILILKKQVLRVYAQEITEDA